MNKNKKIEKLSDEKVEKIVGGERYPGWYIALAAIVEVPIFIANNIKKKTKQILSPKYCGTCNKKFPHDNWAYNLESGKLHCFSCQFTAYNNDEPSPPNTWGMCTICKENANGCKCLRSSVY